MNDNCPDLATCSDPGDASTQTLDNISYYFDTTQAIPFDYVPDAGCSGTVEYSCLIVGGPPLWNLADSFCDGMDPATGVLSFTIAAVDTRYPAGAYQVELTG